MKIACLPDLHCYYTGPGPEEARLEEFRNCAQTAKEIIRHEKCEMVLVPGDLFVTNRPSPAQLMEVINFLTDLPHTYVIAGNHDVGVPGQPNFVNVLATAHMFHHWGITHPRTILTDTIALILMPFVKDMTDDLLIFTLRQQVAQALEEPGDHKIVVVGHYATDISQYASGDFVVGREPVFRMADLQSLPVDAVILGHIHNPKILCQKPLVLHTGALTRRDAGEAKDERGFFILDTDSMTVIFYEIPARRFVDIKVNNSFEEKLPDVRDSYVRIIIQGTEEEFRKIDTQAFKQKVMDAGAFHITGIIPQLESSERCRLENISEITSPLTALRAWLNLKPEVSNEAKTYVLSKAEELLKGVAA